MQLLIPAWDTCSWCQSRHIKMHDCKMTCLPTMAHRWSGLSQGGACRWPGMHLALEYLQQPRYCKRIRKTWRKISKVILINGPNYVQLDGCSETFLHSNRFMRRFWKVIFEKCNYVSVHSGNTEFKAHSDITPKTLYCIIKYIISEENIFNYIIPISNQTPFSDLCLVMWQWLYGIASWQRRGILILFTCENLWALRFQSSWVFFKRPPGQSDPEVVLIWRLVIPRMNRFNHSSDRQEITTGPVPSCGSRISGQGYFCIIITTGVLGLLRKC